MDDYFLVTIIWIIIWGIIWGVIAKAIGNSKGINGFWWGFCLGILGIIVVACMSDKQQYPSQAKIIQQNNNQTSLISKYDQLEKLAKLKEQGAITEEEFQKEKNKILNTVN